MSAWLWAVVAEEGANRGEARELTAAEVELACAAGELARVLESIVQSHEEDGTRGPESNGEDYCEECQASLAALNAAGFVHVVANPKADAEAAQ